MADGLFVAEALGFSATLTTFTWIWLGLAFASAAIIGLDIIFRHRQKMSIMQAVWPITALYAGPLTLLMYWHIGLRSVMSPAQKKRMTQEMKRKRKEQQQQSQQHKQGQQSGGGGGSKKPFWQKVTTSALHCGAGCTVGDIIAEPLRELTHFTLAGSPLWGAFLMDYMWAWSFGILFQFFAIVPMKHLGPLKGVYEAIKADTLSLTFFQMGMYGWMAIYQKVLFHPRLTPWDAEFWFMMQFGMILGLITTWPVNWVLVRSGIKEGM